jgi:hypothetical protein
MTTTKTTRFGTFAWRVIASHTVAYSIAGILALAAFDYRGQFASGSLSTLMRPVDSAWTAAGAGLQPLRGLLIAAVLFPFRKVVLETARGWLKLLGLVLGLSYLSTIGPTFGSFEGYVFTRVPIADHLLGLPEALCYALLFAFFLTGWYAKPRKLWQILAIVLVGIVLLSSLLGVLASLQLLQGGVSSVEQQNPLPHLR